MPKATIQYLTDAGFRGEQFGDAPDFATATAGYLARVLADAAAMVRSNVGASAYDAVVAESIDETRLRRAEEQAAKAELWTRRAAFIDGSSVQAMDRAAYLERREYLRAASDAQALASYWIDEFLAGGDSPGERAITGMSSGTVTTGPWAQTP